MPNVVIIRDAGVQGPPGPPGPSGSGGGGGFPFSGSAVITGSLVITGSVTSTQGFTGSLLGTASYSLNSLFQVYTLNEQYNQYATEIIQNIDTTIITGSIFDVTTYTDSFHIFEIISDSYVISLVNNEGEDLVDNNYLGLSGSDGIALLKAGTFFSAPFDSNESGSYFTSIVLASGYADQEVKLYNYLSPPTFLTSSYKITDPIFFTENILVEDSITVPLLIGTSTNAQVADKALSAIENASIAETNTITFTKSDESTFSINVPPFVEYTQTIQQEELSSLILDNSNITSTITGSDVALVTHTGSFQVLYVKNASKLKEVVNQNDINLTRSLNITEDVILNTGVLLSAPSGSYFKRVTFNYGTNQEITTYNTQIGENTASFYIPKENYYLTRSNIKIYGDLEVTGSIIGNIPAANTGSLLVTASVNSNTITFVKGNGTTFPITVNTGSVGSGFPYTGSAIITGSLIITGSTISTLGFTGSLSGTSSYALQALSSFPFTGSARISGSLDLNGPLNVDVQNFNILNDTFNPSQTSSISQTTINLQTKSNRLENINVYNTLQDEGWTVTPTITSGSLFYIATDYYFPGENYNYLTGSRVFFTGSTDAFGVTNFKYVGNVINWNRQDQGEYSNYFFTCSAVTTTTLIPNNGFANIQNYIRFYSPTSSGVINLDGFTSISKNLTVTGSIQSTQGFTGSLQGTASYATNALTASYIANASSFPFTGSARISGSLDLNGPLNPDIQNFSILNDTFNPSQTSSISETIINLQTKSNRLENTASFNSIGIDEGWRVTPTITSGSLFTITASLGSGAENYNNITGSRVFFTGSTDAFGVPGFRYIGNVINWNGINQGDYTDYILTCSAVTTATLTPNNGFTNINNFFRFYPATSSGVINLDGFTSVSKNLTVTGSTNLRTTNITGSLNITGSVNVRGQVSASSYIGSGASLTGVVNNPMNSAFTINANTTITGSLNLNGFNELNIGTANFQGKTVNLGQIETVVDGDVNNKSDTNTVTFNRNLDDLSTATHTQINFGGRYWVYSPGPELYNAYTDTSNHYLRFTSIARNSYPVYGRVIDLQFSTRDTGSGVARGFSTNYSGTTYFNVTGSLGISTIMTLTPQSPLPTTGVPSASFATSGSGANLKPYFWNGSTWTPLF